MTSETFSNPSTVLFFSQPLTPPLYHIFLTPTSAPFVHMTTKIIHISLSSMIRIANCACAFCHLSTPKKKKKSGSVDKNEGRAVIEEESESCCVCDASDVLFMSFISSESSFSLSRIVKASGSQLSCETPKRVKLKFYSRSIRLGASLFACFAGAWADVEGGEGE